MDQMDYRAVLPPSLMVFLFVVEPNRHHCLFRSMAQALPMVKRMVQDLVDSGSKVSKWVLTNFKDPNVELVTSTNNVDDLRSSLNALSYGGGGDLTEQALQGKVLCLFLIFAQELR